MAAESRVQQLLDEISDSGRTPEEVCGACPELLPEVRRRWRQMCRRRGGARCAVPGAGARPGRRDLRVPGMRPPTCRGSRAMRWRRCSAAGAWASSTGPGTCGSTAWSPSRCCSPAPYAGPPERARFQREAEAVAEPAPREHRRRSTTWATTTGVPVLHDGVRRRGQPGPGPGGHAAAGPPGGRAAGHAGRGRAGGAPGRDRPPRPQAGQHPAHRRRHAQGRRFRAGAALRRRAGADAERRPDRDAELHGPRAGDREGGTRSGRPRTSTPSAPSSTRCSPAGRRSGERRRRRRSGRCSTTSRSPPRG